MRRILTEPTYFYVDPGRGNDKDDGSRVRPWKTLQHAVNEIARNVDGAGASSAGRQFLAGANGVIDKSGTLFPGNTPGEASSGGQVLG